MEKVRLSVGFYQRDDHPSAGEYYEKMSYDLNGNISGLNRTASLAGNTTAGLIDNLTYQYFNNNNSNRLRTVTDSSTDYRGYPDVSGTEIGYDSNGNMTSHKDKGILNINYNYLNLPDYIKFDKLYLTRGVWQNVNTGFIYRADGVKLKKTYKYSENSLYKVKTTEYLDGFQYEVISTSADPQIKFIPTAEGYYNFENNKYIYNYTDHLGNVRLSYSKNGSSIEVLEENNYYPFGMKHEGYNVLAGNSAYQYKYNGKELQETGMYDYGARFYMPDVGRWGVVDPLAEKHTDFNPMMYAANNPIMMIDPDGKDWTITESYDKKTNKTHYQITFTGAVLNSSSNKNINMKKFASSVQSQTEAIFNSIGNNPNITVSASINIRTIGDKEELKSTDTLIEIKDSSSKDFDVYKNGKTDVVGRAMNGKEISVNEKYVDDMISGSNSKTMPHELGHTAGLQHPAMGTKQTWFDLPEKFSTLKNNFMIQGTIPKATGLNVHQMNRMYRLYKTNKLNNKKIDPVQER